MKENKKEIAVELLKLGFQILKFIIVVVGLGIILWKGFF